MEGTSQKEIRILDKVFIPFIGESEIRQYIERLAQVINREEHNTHPLFLVVLNGSFIFAADLLKQIHVPCEIEFIKVRSYEGTTSTGKVEMIFSPSEAKYRNRTVILVEDIVDTGNTVEFLYHYLYRSGAGKVKICTLFFKPEAYKKTVPIEWIGQSIENRFIVGYGLDYEGYGRNLRSVYVLK